MISVKLDGLLERRIVWTPKVLKRLSLFGFPRRSQKQIFNRKLPYFRKFRQALFGLIFLIGFASAGQISAATFNVNTFSDTHAVTPSAGTGLDSTGKISLRSALEVVESVGGTQTVNLPTGTYNLSLGTITFGDVAQNVTITGASAATTIVNMTTTAQNRIFLIGTTGTLPNVHTSISNVQFTGGKLTGDNYGGGAILAGGPSNSLTLTNCIFQNNTIATAVAGAPGGGAVRYNGGGSLTITGSVFNNNSNPLSAGGAVDYFFENLVGIGNGVVTITNSTFTNNSVTATGASGGALNIAAQGRITAGVTFTVSVLRNTFSGNAASGTSGVGGAISVTNSFDVGNTAQFNNNRIFGNTSNIAPSAMAVAGGSQGNVDATDNWWGVNTGPGTSAAKLGAGGGTFSIGTWLQLRHNASPTTIVTGDTSTLTADIFGRNSGGPISAATLNGMSAFPATATTLFSNAVRGTLSAASTQFVNGTATAIFTGTSSGAGSADAAVDSGTATANLTINQASTTTAITSDVPDPSVRGQTVTVNYTVTPQAGGTPTGNVTVSDGVNSCVGTAAAGSCNVALTTVGNRTLTATYAGDANFTGSVSAGAAHTVNKASTTAIITAESADPTSQGQVFTVFYAVSASAPGSGTPTGNVTVSDGVDSCVGTVAAGQCSLALATSGARTLIATYAGDASFNGAVSPGEPHSVLAVVQSTNTTITSDNPDPSVRGQTITVTFTVVPQTSGTPTGNVTVSDGVNSCVGTVATGSCNVALTTVGGRTLTATYAGDANFTGSVSVGAAHTVSKANTTAIITAESADPTSQGQMFTVFYVVSATAPGSGTPTGNVTVSDGVDSCVGTVAAGQCSLALATSGARTLIATYAGDAGFNGAVSPGEPHSVLVVVQSTTTTITSDNPDPSVRGQSITVTYTVTPQTGGTPTGNVTVGDGVDSCVGTVAAGSCNVALTTVGSRSLNATYAGDANFTGSVSAGAAHTVDRADTSTAITAESADPTSLGQVFTAFYIVSATAPGTGTPTGNVTVSDGVDNCIGTAAAGQCTLALNTSGARTLTATYAGDASFIGSVSAGEPHTVLGQAPLITSANATTFTVGTAGTFIVTTSGNPTPSISRGGAPLPANLTFVNNGDGTATLSGTPAPGTGGSYSFTFTAMNGTTPNATQNFTLTVNQSPAITSANSTTFIVGTSGSFTVTKTGSPAPTLSVTGALPAGVTFVPATGVLGGTPAAGTGGTYPLVFTASNGVGSDATQNFILTVNQAPAITSASSTTFTVGTSGSFAVTTAGSPPPTLSVTGALPAGVTFIPATGLLSGTPAVGTGGSYPLVFTASNGVGSDATQNFTLTVNQAPAITSASSTTFTVGTSGSFTVTKTGFPAPTLGVTGSLPTGVTFVPATGVLSGTPAAGNGGTYPLTFTANNGIGSNATQSFILTVNQAPNITSANNVGFSVGTSGSFQLTAAGFPTTFTFSNTGSALPTGITLSPSGLLAGTPGAGTGGTYNLMFQVSNGVAPVGTQSFTLTIGLVTLAVNNVNVAEGNAGTTTLSFMLTRTNSLGAASVDVQTTDGTATVADGDYVALGLTTINFANGVATQPVAITVNGDTKFEPDETVLLNLSNPVNVALSNSQGTGTITNDDPQPSISINDVSQVEGQSGTSAFTFIVSLSNASSQGISMMASSADGTATLADMDYVQLMPTLVSFAAGQTSMPVVVTVNGDTTVESDENFFVNLSAPVNATILDGQGIGTIINDDVAITSFTGPTVTGTGTFTATFTGGGANCAFDLGNSGLIGAPPGSGAVPPTLPAPGAVFAHGLFAATIQGCSIGSTLSLTYIYPSALPAGSIFWKYGPTLADTNPHWYQFPAMISGASVSFTITDGGLGDDDLIQNGRIVDPAGPALVTPAVQPVQPVPALSQFATLLMLLLVAGIAARNIQSRASR